MKAIEQDFQVELFIMLYKMVPNFKSVKAIEKYFHAAQVGSERLFLYL